MPRYVKTAPNPAGHQRQAAAFDYLLAAFQASAGQPPAQRWPWLEAAHVVGLNRLALQWRAHWHMLAYARALGDGFEVRGQWARLGLTVLGHLVRRLPQGNTGRAIVPAFRSMVPGPLVRERITQAMAAVAPASAQPGAGVSVDSGPKHP
ncbi:Protein of unknown function [Oryzisolibacter propanilivorax]|uniref:DUF3703 domain-containing protein n=1 Tax=Oryzisolibacter propanilivorax TaxID=1527607 RepID=A0A1G9SR20_9BURK|nr:DUF3703 domain-containing protein [Oryzisolibacter propanilivorax]SDM37830.1 Protein of unknown function [Oryzisolibacter propanilivorax]